MCGEYGNSIYLYYGNSEGSLSGGKTLTDSEGNAISGTGRFTGPSIADIDGDGLKDLLVACSVEGQINSYDGPGGIKYYKNIGTIGEPKYEFKGYIKDKSGVEIRHVYLRIQVADMNNDGLLDIVTGNTVDKNKPDVPSAMYMYKNIGTLTEPVFDEAAILTHVDGSEIPGNYAIRIGVGDINNDGVKDIFYNTSHHFTGKVGILIGNLGITSKGNVAYSVKMISKDVQLKNEQILTSGMARLKVFTPLGRNIKEITIYKKFDVNELKLSKGFYLIEISNSDNIQIFKYEIN